MIREVGAKDEGLRRWRYTRSVRAGDDEGGSVEVLCANGFACHRVVRDRIGGGGGTPSDSREARRRCGDGRGG